MSEGVTQEDIRVTCRISDVFCHAKEGVVSVRVTRNSLQATTTTIAGGTLGVSHGVPRHCEAAMRRDGTTIARLFAERSLVARG